jgi:hypothetical protein
MSLLDEINSISTKDMLQECNITIKAYDAIVISLALQSLRKQCLRNANNSLAGYGSCDSQTRYENWLELSENLETLSDEIIYKFI